MALFLDVLISAELVVCLTQLRSDQLDSASVCLKFAMILAARTSFPPSQGGTKGGYVLVNASRPASLLQRNAPVIRASSCAIGIECFNPLLISPLERGKNIKIRRTAFVACFLDHTGGFHPAFGGSKIIPLISEPLHELLVSNF